eukprot:PhM_4_TR523/c0_g1_i1/m.38966
MTTGHNVRLLRAICRAVEVEAEHTCRHTTTTSPSSSDEAASDCRYLRVGGVAVAVMTCVAARWLVVERDVVRVAQRRVGLVELDGDQVTVLGRQLRRALARGLVIADGDSAASRGRRRTTDLHDVLAGAGEIERGRRGRQRVDGVVRRHCPRTEGPQQRLARFLASRAHISSVQAAAFVTLRARPVPRRSRTIAEAAPVAARAMEALCVAAQPPTAVSVVAALDARAGAVAPRSHVAHTRIAADTAVRLQSRARDVARRPGVAVCTCARAVAGVCVVAHTMSGAEELQRGIEGELVDLGLDGGVADRTCLLARGPEEAREAAARWVPRHIRAVAVRTCRATGAELRVAARTFERNPTLVAVGWLVVPARVIVKARKRVLGIHLDGVDGGDRAVERLHLDLDAGGGAGDWTREWDVRGLVVAAVRRRGHGTRLIPTTAILDVAPRT